MKKYLIIFIAVLQSCSPINKNTLGVNAFANNSSFGTISEQYLEVKNQLGVNYVRVLFNWNDQVQPTPSSIPDFSFYDSIAQSWPAGLDALIIINGLPSWMSDSTNWINGNQRDTFIQLWLEPVIQRYATNSQIVGWEIWNEPNDNNNPQNITLELSESSNNGPQNYVALLSSAYKTAKSITPTKLVISAATTSINQNYPNSLNYGKSMQQAGAESFCDIWGIHYYGKEYDHIFLPGGIKAFLNSLTLPIWLTESGAKGVNNQLQYVNETWAILEDEINNLDRIYYYQFTEATPPDSTYGLRNLGPGQEYSDLYNYLSDKNQ